MNSFLAVALGFPLALATVIYTLAFGVEGLADHPWMLLPGLIGGLWLWSAYRADQRR